MKTSIAIILIGTIFLTFTTCENIHLRMLNPDVDCTLYKSEADCLDKEKCRPGCTW